jgi:hypothetical protein
LFFCKRDLQATKPPNPAYKGTLQTSMNQNKLWKTDLKDQGIGALLPIRISGAPEPPQSITSLKS